jgi:hypothetical protein
MMDKVETSLWRLTKPFPGSIVKDGIDIVQAIAPEQRALFEILERGIHALFFLGGGA